VVENILVLGQIQGYHYYETRLVHFYEALIFYIVHYLVMTPLARRAGVLELLARRAGVLELLPRRAQVEGLLVLLVQGAPCGAHNFYQTHEHLAYL
jgi:hypothetical protein